VIPILRWWWACAVWAVVRAGYWLRPYDMLADRRRWRWQPAQRCRIGGAR
jgi:hypothetical protein